MSRAARHAMFAEGLEMKKVYSTPVVVLFNATDVTLGQHLPKGPVETTFTSLAEVGFAL